MSVACSTHFLQVRDAEESREAIIYRHVSGEPEYTGRDLIAFIDRVRSLPDPRLSDASYLAAKYVVYLAELSRLQRRELDRAFGRPSSGTDDPLDFLSVGVVQDDPPDIEYLYEVVCDGSGRVRCFQPEEDVDASSQPEAGVAQRRTKDGILWVEVPIPTG